MNMACGHVTLVTEKALLVVKSVLNTLPFFKLREMFSMTAKDSEYTQITSIHETL